MKTSNKKFKVLVQDHIIECLDSDLESVINEFHVWYVPHTQKRYPNRQQAFCEFLKCLPSSIGIEYEYYKVSNTVREWYDTCDMTYNEKRSGTSEEFEFYLRLIYREFMTLLKKENLTLFD